MPERRSLQGREARREARRHSRRELRGRERWVGKQPKETPGPEAGAARRPEAWLRDRRLCREFQALRKGRYGDPDLHFQMENAGVECRLPGMSKQVTLKSKRP